MTDEELAAWLAQYRQVLESAHDKGQRIASIVDLRGSEAPSAGQRRIQADWNRETERLVQSVTISVAFVVATKLMRGIMTAVFWMKPPPSPYAVFDHMEDALTWTLNACKRNGVYIDPDSERASRLALSA